MALVQARAAAGKRSRRTGKTWRFHRPDPTFAGVCKSLTMRGCAGIRWHDACLIALEICHGCRHDRAGHDRQTTEKSARMNFHAPSRYGFSPVSSNHRVLGARSVRLSAFSRWRREPGRPLAFRTGRFDEEFDDDTLVFDAVAAGPERIVLLAPALLNLAAPLRDTEFSTAGVRRPARIRQMDRHAQVWIDVPRGTTTIRGAGPLGEFEVEVADDGADLFRGRRVIFTMSKNNPIEWILDWVRFNRDVHGADAVLIYDNASDRYDSDTLSAALQTVDGIAASAVVEWPFKYGPQGLDSWRFWDSDFCQLGAWEHARWRFLRDACSVMNSDIDELVLSRDGRSVFAAAERSAFGLVRYFGRWVIGAQGYTREVSAASLLRHRDFDLLMPPDYRRSRLVLRRDMNRCFSKWTIVPRRCPENAQWGVHKLHGWWPTHLSDPNFSFRHFREIANNWKYRRDDRPSYDPAIHRRDGALVEAFGRVRWEK